MNISPKKKLQNWQASLMFVLLGAAVGYASFENINFWGGTVSRYQILFATGFFIGVLIFVTGFVNFLVLAVRSVAMPHLERRSASEQPHESNVRTPSTLQTTAEAAPLLWRAVNARFVANGLRAALTTVVVLNGMVIWYWGGPDLDSSYGRWYWLRVVITFVLSQLPYAVVLIRIRQVPDRPGLALAMAASTTQMLAALFTGLRYPATAGDPWPWLSIPLGAVVIALSSGLWRATPRRKDNVGLLVSVCFGFVAYTALAQIAVAILHARTHA